MQHTRFPYFININEEVERNNLYVTVSRLLNLNVRNTVVHKVLILSHALLYEKAQKKLQHFRYK